MLNTFFPISSSAKGLIITAVITNKIPLNIPELEKEQIRFYFEEFSEYEGQCRFNGCVHINEPDCRVKEAVEAGLISRRRYTSYVEIYDEVKNKKKY